MLRPAGWIMWVLLRSWWCRPAVTALPLSYRSTKAGAPGGIRTCDRSLNTRQQPPAAGRSEDPTGSGLAVLAVLHHGPVGERTTRVERPSPGWKPGALPSELRPRGKGSTPGWSRTSGRCRRGAALCPLSYGRGEEPPAGFETSTLGRTTGACLSLTRRRREMERRAPDHHPTHGRCRAAGPARASGRHERIVLECVR